MIKNVDDKVEKLNFKKGNARLAKDVAVFCLPAGWTCPGAQECLVKADRETGKLTGGKDIKYRCYAAHAENQYPNTRNSRWRNLNMLKGKTRLEMAALIFISLPDNVSRVRIHESGDFFSESYFLAWCDVAKMAGPGIRFYAYTKSVHFWVKHIADLPQNLILTASRGGMFDGLIDEYGLNECEVVFSKGEAKQKQLEIDYDDSHAFNGHKQFALLLHGMQPKGSEAKKALDVLMKEKRKRGQKFRKWPKAN